jgi:signal transduction histidine kinase/CheY-like chemotaxis protein
MNGAGAWLWRVVLRRPWLIGIAAFGGLCALVGGVAASALHTQAERDTANQWEIHSVVVQLETAKLFSELQDAEARQRAFLLTNDATYLQPEGDIHRAIFDQLQRLVNLTRDNNRQQKRLGTLQQLISERLNHLDLVIKTARDGNTHGAIELVREGQGRILMNAVRREMFDLNAEESRLLAERQVAAMSASQAADRSLWWVIGVGVSLILASMLAAVAAIRSERRAQRSANQSAVDREVRAQLQTRVEEATVELRRTEAQLRQTQKMEAIGQLTGGIAHDFNNMLAVIIGSLEIALRRIATSRDSLPSIDNAMDAAKRAATLTHRLLAFARLQPLEPAVVDANKLVADMSELLRRTLGEQLRLETVLSGGLWTCEADPHQLESALVNLAVNARDAMPDGGKLTVETGNAHLDDAYAANLPEVQPGQYVLIAITDTGVGMPADVIAKAFDPFFTTKSVGKGTGLGLSQVFGFVKQSGGHVSIYSEVGNGTTVKLYLPRHFGDRLKLATGEQKSSMPPGGSLQEIILVVEDDERVRQISVDALRELGYTVSHAADPQEALKILEANSGVTLLFTDIVMPGMNGRQLAEAALRTAPGLKVLFTTGYTRNAVLHDGTLDPGVAFLQKPFTFAQLSAKVRQVIDGDS